MKSRWPKARCTVAGTIGILLSQPLWAAPRRFDLACVGLEHGSELNGVYTRAHGQPSSMRLRIDLDRKLWCIEKCVRPGAIKVSPETLNLEGGYGDNNPTTTINRRTGVFSRHSPYGSILVITSYKCTPVRFTGIPKLLF